MGVRIRAEVWCGLGVLGEEGDGRREEGPGQEDGREEDCVGAEEVRVEKRVSLCFGCGA